MSQGYYARHEHAPGALLAAAREELNLSVSDVARHLKLSPAQVEALEEGAYDRLPGRVFVRGFLRNYAKLLGIDPQPLLRTIEHEMPQPVAVEEAPPSAEVVMPRETPAKWPMQLLFVVMTVVILLAIYEFGFNEAPTGDAKEASTPAGAISDPSTSAPAAQVATGSPGASTAAPANATAAAKAAPPATPPAMLPATPPATLPASVAGVRPPTVDAKGTAMPGAVAAAPGGDVAKAATAGQRALYFRFEKDSWVEIRDRNDKVIYSKLNRAGSEDRVTAAPPLKLVVGNARSVRLDYDERTVDLTPHIGVTVARLTLQ